jgi:hypothetical protein
MATMLFCDDYRMVADRFATGQGGVKSALPLLSGCIAWPPVA